MEANGLLEINDRVNLMNLKNMGKNDFKILKEKKIASLVFEPATSHTISWLIWTTSLFVWCL